MKRTISPRHPRYRRHCSRRCLINIALFVLFFAFNSFIPFHISSTGSSSSSSSRKASTCAVGTMDGFETTIGAACSSKATEKHGDVVSLSTGKYVEDPPSLSSMYAYIAQRLPVSSVPDDDGILQKQRNDLVKNLEYAYSNVQEMLDRNQRFPSIEQRVKTYMSNWYIPPCDDSARIPYQYLNAYNHDTTVLIKELSLPQDNLGVVEPFHEQSFFEINSRFDPKNAADAEGFDEVHYMDRQAFLDCTHIYCKDTVKYLLPSLDRYLSNDTIAHDATNIPMFFQFGDMFETRATMRNIQTNEYSVHIQYPRIPVFQKVRVSKSLSDVEFETDETSFQCYNRGERRTTTTSNGFHFSHPINTLQMEPIIFKLKTFRHYSKIYKVVDADTIPWQEKKNVAIFRGALTGSYTNGMKSKEAKQLTVPQRCQILLRCWFTYTHASSKLVDAKLTEPFAPNRNIPRVVEDKYDDDNDSSIGEASRQIHLYGDRMSMEELLQYKALVLLEGNDMSSGLKWALFSTSIVMMPEPTLTSWSMEEKLQPWVHYVPINVYRTNSSDGTTTVITTDAEEKMQWIIDNDDRAREIVKASTLWIADLVFHPDEANDEERISDEIVRRYLTHFVPSHEVL